MVRVILPWMTLLSSFSMRDALVTKFTLREIRSQLVSIVPTYCRAQNTRLRI
jgi:hypothetical protein